MKTNLQIGIEKQRAVYESLELPLLAQLINLHGITVRDFALIFGISKSLAWEIVTHKKMPSLELAIKIARYYECTVDDMFGWRVDDTGDRRPLLAVIGSGKAVVRLKSQDKSHRALNMVAEIAQRLKVKKAVVQFDVRPEGE